MKKYLLGVAAIVMAVGIVAFKPADSRTTNKEMVTTYWFLVHSSIELDEQIADEDAVFLEMNTGLAPTESSCSSGEKYCIVGFTNSSQVNEFQPGEYEIVGNQVPSARPSTKP